MGTRAGERFAATGIPTPNPFPSTGRTAAAAAAWRAGYFGALTAGRSGTN
jgi:hypothetical protein